jgi:hypothetical protein
MPSTRSTALAAVALAFGLAACSPGALVQTSLGTVRVTEDPDLARFSVVRLSGGEQVDAFPDFGGLVVTGAEGALLELEDRALARAALAAYCGGAVPPDLSYRGVFDGGSTWSSAPCPETPPDGPAS